MKQLFHMFNQSTRIKHEISHETTLNYLEVAGVEAGGFTPLPRLVNYLLLVPLRYFVPKVWMKKSSRRGGGSHAGFLRRREKPQTNKKCFCWKKKLQKEKRARLFGRPWWNEDFWEMRILSSKSFFGRLFYTWRLFFALLKIFCKIFSGPLFYKFTSTPVLACTGPFDWPRSSLRIWGFFWGFCPQSNCLKVDFFCHLFTRAHSLAPHRLSCCIAAIECSATRASPVAQEQIVGVGATGVK